MRLFWSAQAQSPHMQPLVRALRQRGHRVITTSNSSFIGRRTAIGWSNSNAGLFHRYRGATAVALALRLAYQFKPTDIAIFGDLPRLFSARMVFFIAILLMRRRLIFILERPNWSGPMVQKIKFFRDIVYYRFVGIFIERILAISELGRCYYSSVLGRAERVFTFGYFPARNDNIVDPEWLATIDAADRYLMLVAGSFVPRKGVDLALHAFTRILAMEPTLRPLLLIAGGGEDEAMLKALAIDLGIAGDVRWLGLVNYEALTAVMHTVDLVVVPSRHDGWGTVPNEALQAGCPVVVTDCSGSACLITDDRLGSVVPPTSDALALACHQELQLGRLPQERREIIRHWAYQSISPEAAADYTIAILALHNIEHQDRPVPPWMATGLLPD